MMTADGEASSCTEESDTEIVFEDNGPRQRIRSNRLQIRLWEQPTRKNLAMVIYSQPSAANTTHLSQGTAPIRSVMSSPPEHLITQGTSLSLSRSIPIDFKKMKEVIQELQSSFGSMRDYQRYAKYNL
ncbi:hypothetical protein F511_28870 [Dorcoceras hygrometricum]|uniref:Uncharacterized protein n=1 Tax=Dorcoceras hygrometricum TaxID=472368 RepID=A0A2Z7DAR5_9LAMI|nr:hypothetical protein F511_28870 [Dorcoceras hygrometricum]